MDALSILSAAMLPKSPTFVKKPEFSQEVVRQAHFFLSDHGYFFFVNPGAAIINNNLFLVTCPA